LARTRPPFERRSQKPFDLFDSVYMIHVEWMHRDPNGRFPSEGVKERWTDKRRTDPPDYGPRRPGNGRTSACRPSGNVDDP